MTYQQYKAELLWIKCSRAEVYSAIAATLTTYEEAYADDYREVTYWPETAQKCGLRDENGYTSESGTRTVLRLFREINNLDSYRCRLARWFWGSHLGNPPVFSKEK